MVMDFVPVYHRDSFVLFIPVDRKIVNASNLTFQLECLSNNTLF